MSQQKSSSPQVMQPQQETPGLNLKSGRKKVISMFYTKKPALFQAFISMFQTLNGVGEGGGGSSLENNQEKKKTSSVVSSMCGRCGNGFQGTMMPTVSGFDRVLIPPSNALARSPVCTVIVNKILYGSSFPL